MDTNEQVMIGPRITVIVALHERLGGISFHSIVKIFSDLQVRQLKRMTILDSTFEVSVS
jgi:hypothetical protein